MKTEGRGNGSKVCFRHPLDTLEARSAVHNDGNPGASLKLQQVGQRDRTSEWRYDDNDAHLVQNGADRQGRRSMRHVSGCTSTA